MKRGVARNTARTSGRLVPFSVNYSRNVPQYRYYEAGNTPSQLFPEYLSIISDTNVVVRLPGFIARNFLFRACFASYAALSEKGISLASGEARTIIRMMTPLWNQYSNFSHTRPSQRYLIGSGVLRPS
jgi:hypothetical protein